MPDIEALDPKILHIITVPDGQPEQATPFQGFAFSLCRNSRLLRFIQQVPADVFEFSPKFAPYRISRRIAGQAPINWFGQTPSVLRSQLVPLFAPFVVVYVDETEQLSDYSEWLAACEAPVTLVGANGGHIKYDDLSVESLQSRFLDVCGIVKQRFPGEEIDKIAAAIASWQCPGDRALPFEVGGHGTVMPNLSVLNICGYVIGEEPFDRHGEGESAHIEQITLTTGAILDIRDEHPPVYANRIFPRSPDLNLYAPATYDLKTRFPLNPKGHEFERQLAATIKILEQQDSYNFEARNAAQKMAMLGTAFDDLKAGKSPRQNPAMAIRQMETWLGTEAVGCLASSEIGAVLRLPNRINRTRGIVRQFAEHYRADKPQLLKRSELFRGVQKAIAAGVPEEFVDLIKRSNDGIRIIADAHLEWLDIDGIPLGLRFDVSRIPVTPGNALIGTLAMLPKILLKPEDFHKVLIVSGLPKDDEIARTFTTALQVFGEQWRNKVEITYVRANSKKALIEAMNAFDGHLMIFDGHGSHDPDRPGYLWLDKEPVDIWSLRGEVRAPAVAILSACDTHAADRNHATVANGFLSLGCRSVLGSVFPLQANDAAIFAARLIYRIAEYVPAAVNYYGRSITWKEVVSGMLRRQLVTDILSHLQKQKLFEDGENLENRNRLHAYTDFHGGKAFEKIRNELAEMGGDASKIDIELRKVISSSSTISYLQLGRPESIIINSEKNISEMSKIFSDEANFVPVT